MADVRQDNICGVRKYYFVLKSVYDVNSTIYIPTDCGELVSSMEKVIAPDEIEQIIIKAKSTDIMWQKEL